MEGEQSHSELGFILLEYDDLIGEDFEASTEQPDRGGSNKKRGGSDDKQR
jgi:hypothetical protein